MCGTASGSGAPGPGLAPRVVAGRPGAGTPLRRALRARSRRPPGVSAKTCRIVSLHCRTLENPAANAMWVTGSSVVSSRIRAVWQRRARATASGPVPTSAVTRRLSCRVL